MQNKRGYTLVEMIFVLSIIISTSMISIYSFQYHSKRTISFNEVESGILNIIDEAKSISINQHIRINIQFSKNNLKYTYDGNLKQYILPDNYYFDDIKEIYFNANGNINQGNHIDLVCPESKKQIVFNLGAGDYYIK